MWILLATAILLVSVGVVLFLIIKMNAYELIARNTTYIHEILSDEFKNRFPNKDVLLATCGVIDTMKYVREGSLTVDEIVTGVLTSCLGQCSLDLIEVDITDNPSYHLFVRQPDIVYFVYFVMQLEALILRVDSNLTTEHILTAVKSNKSIIEKEVIRTQRKYKEGGAPPWWKAATYMFMNGEACAGLRDKLGIINKKNYVSNE